MGVALDAAFDRRPFQMRLSRWHAVARRPPAGPVASGGCPADCARPVVDGPHRAGRLSAPPARTGLERRSRSAGRCLAEADGTVAAARRAALAPADAGGAQHAARRRLGAGSRDRAARQPGGGRERIGHVAAALRPVGGIARCRRAPCHCARGRSAPESPRGSCALLGTRLVPGDPQRRRSHVTRRRCRDLRGAAVAAAARVRAPCRRAARAAAHDRTFSL